MMHRDEQDDEWVFDTIKAPTMQAKKNTTKRRKLSVVHPNGLSSQGISEDAFSALSLKDSPLDDSSPSPTTVRKSTVRHAPSVLPSPPSQNTAGRRPSTSGRTSIRRPLQPDMSFGNSGSTVRLFRRVSDASSHGPDSLSKNDENRQPHSETTTKDALWGRRAHAKAVEPAFQEIHAQTSSLAKREAISRLADAWNTLDALDPEGEYALLKMIIDRVYCDPKLAGVLLPEDSGTVQVTPQKHQAQAPKLAANSGNPQVKSHRRGQSENSTHGSNGAAGGDLLFGGEKEKLKNLPGVAVSGMEHSKQLADVLYGRWIDGLRNRWGGA